MDRRTFTKTALAGGLVMGTPLRALAAGGAIAKPKITTDLQAITRLGGETTVNAAALQELQESMRGQLLLSSSEGYEEARQVWNGMIDKRPGVIARCFGAGDVRNAVDFARSHDLLVAVRGGGHNVAGKGVCEGGIMIDLAPMRGVRVDPIAKTARLQSGCLLGDLDQEAQQFGLTTPAGTVSHTGAAGLTLGGGHGRIGRSYGLTCDNVKSFDLITADGQFRRASADEHADLYWGLKGGGGNFGVVTSFEYNLHEVGPTILFGGMMYSLAQAKEVLKFYAEYTATIPDELAIDLVVVSRPGGPAFVTLSICYIGDLAKADSLLDPIRAFKKPMVDGVKPMPYVKMQQSADRTTPPGRQYYNKAGLLTEMPDKLIDDLVDHIQSEEFAKGDPGSTTLIIVQQLGGAIGRLDMDATAYAHRDARFDFLVLSGWDDTSMNDQNIQSLRNIYGIVDPHTIGFYSNHMVDGDNDRAKAAFRHNYDRLAGLKNQYDPTNLFRLNANIKPTV